MLRKKSWDEMPLHSITQLSAAFGKWLQCFSCITHEGNMQMIQNSAGKRQAATHPLIDILQMPQTACIAVSL